MYSIYKHIGIVLLSASGSLYFYIKTTGGVLYGPVEGRRRRILHQTQIFKVDDIADPYTMQPLSKQKHTAEQ